jgi:hypothetical protein
VLLENAAAGSVATRFTGFGVAGQRLRHAFAEHEQPLLTAQLNQRLVKALLDFRQFHAVAPAQDPFQLVAEFPEPLAHVVPRETTLNYDLHGPCLDYAGCVAYFLEVLRAVSGYAVPALLAFDDQTVCAQAGECFAHSVAVDLQAARQINFPESFPASQAPEDQFSAQHVVDHRTLADFRVSLSSHVSSSDWRGASTIVAAVRTRMSECERMTY